MNGSAKIYKPYQRSNQKRKRTVCGFDKRGRGSRSEHRLPQLLDERHEKMKMMSEKVRIGVDYISIHFI